MAQHNPDRDLEMVLGCYAAYARGDIDTTVAALHADVEWIEPEDFPNGGSRVGPAAVAEYLRASRARWAELVSRPVAHRRGQQIVVIHHVSGRLLDGSSAEAEVADVFTVVDGQVVRMQAFADPADGLAATSNG